MSSALNISWKDFGFPDPGFRCPWLPAEGLTKALQERMLPWRDSEWTWDFLTEDCIQYFSMPYDFCARSFIRNFDSKLKSVAGLYLNQFKINRISEDDTLPFWNWDDLLQTAAGPEEKIMDPEIDVLAPEWNLSWLLQRKKAIDLLLYARVDITGKSYSGSVHNGIPLSSAEAQQWAKKNMRVSDWDGDFGISKSTTNIYGPDHGWKEGSYCCDIYGIKELRVKDFSEKKLSGQSYLVMNVQGADGTDESFAPDPGISLGWNVITADQDGQFLSFPDDPVFNPVTPTKDHQITRGWRAVWHGAFSDYSSVFHFKDDHK